MTTTTRRPRALVALLAALAMTFSMTGTALAQDALLPDGRAVPNINLDLADGGEFVGRIANLRLVGAGEDGIQATGRIIGRVLDEDGNVVERINRTFDVNLPLLDEDLDEIDLTDPDAVDDILDGNGVTQILFLELGPIFLDLLGLIVEVPDPIILEIRAEEGPGQLLGNLLVALLGALD